MPEEAYIRLYHPRKDLWTEHFHLEGALILGQTDIGTVTINLLRLNDPERILERTELIELGRYP